MRSKFTGLFLAASVLLAAQATLAETVDDKFRLMEQRMAEMEARLEATSDELRDARTTVAEQQDRMTEAGLLEEEGGMLSGVGSFFEMFDVTGVIAASYNHRLISKGDNNTTNSGLFRHPEANTFAFDQAPDAYDLISGKIKALLAICQVEVNMRF